MKKLIEAFVVVGLAVVTFWAIAINKAQAEYRQLNPVGSFQIACAVSRCYVIDTRTGLLVWTNELGWKGK